MNESQDTHAPEFQFTETLSLLGQCLANNHLHSALRSATAPSGVLLPDRLLRRYNRRVIVVVGAGTSKEAGLPLAPECREALERKHAQEQIFDDRVMRYELRRLRMSSRLPANDFETYLLALSATAYGAKWARDQLSTLYGHRHKPLLSYEILAHLLKHRFVDAIVNFNFDELLDQAIEDELNEGEFEYVLSDGDYEPDQIRADTPLEKPLYIKPHGTVSHPSTLRFTRMAYYEIAPAILALLYNLLNQKPIDLIVCGFSMKSPELLQILSERTGALRVFYIDRQPWAPDERPGGRSYVRHLDVSRTLNSPSGMLYQIWNAASDCFEKRYRPRSISRHECLATIFAREIIANQNEPRGELTYLWDRTIVELCLAIARGRGFVSMNYLVTGRAGYYYRQARALARKLEYEHSDAPRIARCTLLYLCTRFGMRDVSFGEESLVFETVEPHELVVSTEKRHEFLNKMLDNVSKSGEPSTVLTRYVTRHRKKGRDKFLDFLLRQYEDGESEIRLDEAPIFKGTKSHAEHLNTRTALKYHTEKLLRDRRWKVILAISESGEWLLEPTIAGIIDDRKDCIVRLVVSDVQHLDELGSVYGTKLDVRVLSWWLHNQHLTLFQYRNRRALACIHLTRRLRTPDLRPTLTRNGDADAARSTFVAYWIRATEQSTRWIDRSEIDAFRDF